MKKYNISKPRKYTDSQGNEKTYWDRVGEMIEFPKDDGSVSRIVKIPAIGLEAHAFEDKPKEGQSAPVKKTTPNEDTIEYPEDEVSPDDIPF